MCLDLDLDLKVTNGHWRRRRGSIIHSSVINLKLGPESPDRTCVNHWLTADIAITFLPAEAAAF